MKIPAAALLFCSVLAGCGGAPDASSPGSFAPMSAPRAMSATSADTVVIQVYQALYGKAPGNAEYTTYVAQANSSSQGFANTLVANFASMSDKALALMVLNNLGVTATTVTQTGIYQTLLSAVEQLFAAYGLSARGQMILNMTSLLAGLSSDSIYGVAATTYSSQVQANYSYSANSTNTSAGVVALVAVPGAPTIGAATAGTSQASIAFTAPSSTGGASISAYTVSCVTGSSTKTGTGTSSPITVSSLTNGSAYTCSVTATNSAGTGAASGTVAVTPVAGPTTPAILGVLPGDQRISVAFNFIGGKIVAAAGLAVATTATSYTATCTSSDGGTTAFATGYNPIAVMGLTNGKTYTCSVTASADNGGTSTSPASMATIPNGGRFTSSTVLASTTNDSHIQAYPSYSSYCNYVNETATGTGTVPTINVYSTTGSLTTGTSASTITCSGTSTRTITANALPDHISSTFFTNGLSPYKSSPYFSGNPNSIGVKSVSKTFPYSGSISSSYVSGTAGFNTAACYTKKAAGDTLATGCTLVSWAYYNNGVKVEPGTAETYISTSQTYTVEGKNYYQDVGLDPSNSHNQPTMSGSSNAFYGYYHYHGMPEGYISRLGKGNATMTLLGFASDGFPIYARYGYTARTTTVGGVSVMKGNYRVRTAAEISAAGYTDRPLASVAPYGSFVQDWVFDASVGGDLDACNGRYGVTPESPNTAVYHYFVTDTYPYLGRCVWGSSPASWGYTSSANN